MKTFIEVECIDQELMITNSPLVASGGLHENFVSFKFCSKWDQLTKTAVFYKDEKEKYYVALDENNICEVPHEVTDSDGTVLFGVFGVHDETMKTSKVLKYKIVEGAIAEGATPSDPTPDIYQQFLSMYDACKKEQESFIDNQNEVMSEFQKSTQTAIDTAYASSNAYTDQKIADLINGAPTTLDTLKEIADAMAENENVVDALEASIGAKANQSELDTHTGNNTIHVTASERKAWNNKVDPNTNARFAGIFLGNEGSLSYIYVDENDSIWFRCNDSSGNINYTSIPNLLNAINDLYNSKVDGNHDHYRLVNNGCISFLQGDGNLGIYNEAGTLLWDAFNTMNKSNFSLSGTTLTITL